MEKGLNFRPSRARFSDDAADVALLTRIANGDRAALREIYVTYYHPLLRFIYRITGRLELAQEGVNDVMLVVWRTTRRSPAARASRRGSWASRTAKP
jgi:DNA-directed RNA polymerase specialized sigma24 family protein